MTAQSVEREPLLTPWQLQAKSEYAEFGAITPEEISKRHIRILSVLLCLQSDCNENEIEYASIQAIQTLVEYLFQKRYSIDELLYWVYDLGKRGYIAVLDPDEEVLEAVLFAPTSLGEDLYTLTYENTFGKKQFDGILVQMN